MVTVPLTEYVEGKHHYKVANLMGVSKSAICQMLKSDRQIFVDIDGRGRIKAWERKEVPNRQASK